MKIDNIILFTVAGILLHDCRDKINFIIIIFSAKSKLKKSIKIKTSTFQENKFNKSNNNKLCFCFNVK